MRGDLANRCHTVRRRLHRLAEGEGVEPSRRIARPGFQDQLRATARHLPNLAGTPGFEPRISGLESDGLPVSLRRKKFLVHVLGLAPTKDNQVRLIYSQVLFLLSHTCEMEFRFQISRARFQV